MPSSDTAASAAETDTITYRFFPSRGEPVVFPLRFDRRTFRLILPAGQTPPEWTRLDCHKCTNCTLKAATSPFCPTAAGMAAFLPAFGATVSHDKAVVEVDTHHRTIVAKTTMQAGLASLIGLVSATSGCPHTLFLRPMARFHLPFADESETMVRSFSAWLLSTYLAQRQAGRVTAPSLDGLKRHYTEIGIVNACLAERLRTVATRDAMLNAIIILDLFAQIAPANIDGGMEDVLNFLVVEDEAAVG